MKMPTSAHSGPSRALRRALKGAMCMARDRNYVTHTDNPMLTPPPESSAVFFRSFPAHFDVTDKSEREVIRFEFWNVPLDKLPSRPGQPGQPGQLVAQRVRRVARDTGVALNRVHLVLLVPQYSHRIEQLEQRALEGLGAHLEVFPHQFFSGVNYLQRLPRCQLLASQMMVDHFQDVYGSAANLPKISCHDFTCRYLGAGPGDVILSSGALGGPCSWRLVLPSRRPPPVYTQKLDQRVTQRSNVKLQYREYIKAITSDPNYC